LWEVSSGLKVLLSGETSNIEAAAGESRRSALGGSVSYSDPQGLNAASRNEVRYETGTRKRIQFFTVNRVEVQLPSGFAVLGRYRYSQTHDQRADRIEARMEERGVGLAYRPVENDRFNALTRYTRLFDKRPGIPGTGSTLDEVTDVVSVEGVFDVTRGLQWVSKGALRIRNEKEGDESADRTSTYLGIQRLNLGVWKEIDLGVEYRVLHQREAEDMLSGWLTELSWEVMRRVRLGGGYNFTNFSDDEFSMNDYSVEGWFFRMQGRY
jgi:hypothetical protein